MLLPNKEVGGKEREKNKKKKTYPAVEIAD